MTQTSVKEFLAAAKQDEGLRNRLKVAASPQSCVDLAEQSGYYFTTEELRFILSEMSNEELAEIVNPGIAPRRHIKPQ